MPNNDLSPLEAIELGYHETTIQQGLREMQAELDQREGVIEHCLETAASAFAEMGNQLREIRDSRLYLQGYSTFSDYCESRWGFSDERARLLMRGSEVVINLQQTPTLVGVLPTSERHVRPLTSLSPDDQRAAWTEAVQTAPNGKVTAAHVEKVVEQYKPAKVSSFDPDQESAGEVTDDPTPEVEESPSTSRATPGGNANAALFMSESKEWYTPEDLLALVRELFGEIDLDPASNADANKAVKARRYFDRETNGLTQDWNARTVYLNPPYGDEIRAFVQKAKDEYERGAFEEAVLLVPARTDTGWFGLLREYPRCFISGRLTFWNAENAFRKMSAPFPNVVFYLGERRAAFGEVFSTIGDVYTRWSGE